MLTTEDGREIAYDALLVALGARAREAVPNALTFSGPESGAALVSMLDDALAGEIGRLVFAMPAGVGWPLPLYELALLARAFPSHRGATRVEVMLVTPEDRPLALFGSRASDAIAELLALRGISCMLQTTPVGFGAGVLRVAPKDEIEADRVVALARLIVDDSRDYPTTAQGSCRRMPSAGSAPNPTFMRPATQRSSRLSRAGSDAAGRRGRDPHCDAFRLDARADALPAGLAGLALDRDGRALPPRRARHGRVDDQHRSALVAAGEDRRSLPGAFLAQTLGLWKSCRRQARARGSRSSWT